MNTFSRICALTLVTLATTSCRHTNTSPDIQKPNLISTEDVPQKTEPTTASYMREAERMPPPRLAITKLQKTVPTPLEVFQGYDAKLELTISCLDHPAPSWWGELNSGVKAERGHLVSNGRILKRRALCYLARVNYVNGRKESDPRTYSATYLLRLKGLHGPLQFQDTMPLFAGKKPVPKTAVRVDVPLLATGETPKVPQVSRVSGVQIQEVAVANDEYPGSAHVRVKYAALDQGASGVKMKVFDARGREWPVKPQFDISSAFEMGLDDSKSSAFTLDLSSIPTFAGALTVSGYVYSGDGWPATFSAPLRNQSGRIVVKQPVAVHFRILSTRAVVYPGSSLMEPMAIVQVTSGAKTAREVNWSYGSGYLEDSSGRRYSFEAEGARSLGIASFGRGDTIRVNWTISLKSLLRGVTGLKLKSSLSANGGPAIPLSIPLEPRYDSER